MLTFDNFQYESETGRIRAELGSDLPDAHFAAEGDMSLAMDTQRRSLVHITVPTPRLGRLTVERLQSGEQSFMPSAIALQRPGVYAVAENVGIHFVSDFFGNDVPRGFSNYLGPLTLEELIHPSTPS